MLRIVQGGVKNGDKDWLEEKASQPNFVFKDWVAPKDTAADDNVVIYIGGYGFFATAKAKSAAKPRRDWANRFCVPLVNVKLIKPAISLAVIRKRVPKLTWAVYPRSITTPTPIVAESILSLIKERRKRGIVDCDDQVIDDANIDELRAMALLRARRQAPERERVSVNRVRSLAIAKYVLRRSKGICEACDDPAPFMKSDGSPFLEPHHMLRVADGGPDHPRNVIAACPNCHCRAHHAIDATQFNMRLIKKVRLKEEGR